MIELNLFSTAIDLSCAHKKAASTPVWDLQALKLMIGNCFLDSVRCCPCPISVLVQLYSRRLCFGGRGAIEASFSKFSAQDSNESPVALLWPRVLSSRTRI